MNDAASPKVTLYAMPGCLRCHRTRVFLRQHGVCFNEVNVLTNPRALLKLLGTYRLVFPVVVVDGRVFKGSDCAQLTSVLGLKPASARVSGSRAKSE